MKSGMPRKKGRVVFEVEKDTLAYVIKWKR
jgi:hypothetical protein